VQFGNATTTIASPKKKMTRLSSLTQDYPIHIPYQVDFYTTTVGNYIDATKRHVRWKFGFAHIPSIADGETGVSCRGVEIEIHLIWSVISGKFVIYVNEIPLHKQESKSFTIMNRFQYSFILPENILPGMNQIFISVWAAVLDVPRGKSQCTMTFNGQSFHKFFRIFELGGVRMNRIYGNALNNAIDKGQVRPLSELNAATAASHSSMVQGRRMYRSEPKLDNLQSKNLKDVSNTLELLNSSQIAKNLYVSDNDHCAACTREEETDDYDADSDYSDSESSVIDNASVVSLATVINNSSVARKHKNLELLKKIAYK